MIGFPLEREAAALILEATSGLGSQRYPGGSDGYHFCAGGMVISRPLGFQKE